MSIRAGFFGCECYDLILYTARTLNKLGKSVLVMDHSTEQSLCCSIPLESDYDGGEFDYRGITFSVTAPSYMDMDYDSILIYFGDNPNSKYPVDYAFMVINSELHVIANAQELIENESIQFRGEDDGSNPELEELFPKNATSFIALGCGVTRRDKFLASQMGIPRKSLVCVELDEVTMECRLLCQYNNIYKFHGINAEFKELIYRLTCCLSGCVIEPKLYRKNIKKHVERGC